MEKGPNHVSESNVHPEYVYKSIKQQAGFSAKIHYVDNKYAEHIINRSEKRMYRSSDIGRGNIGFVPKEQYKITKNISKFKQRVE